MSPPLVVIKQDLAGRETWRYEGRLLKRDAHSALIEAFFNRPDLPFHGITFAEGDRFIELYFSDRWYNLYEIHDPASGVVKGWYCNISRPAQILPERISYVDLALDLLVYPDGRQLVLDKGEFEALDLDTDDHKQALRALAELRKLFHDGKVRFTPLPDPPFLEL